MRRISAGVPAGSQFSASVRGEAAVDLNGRESEIAAAARAARPLKNQTPADLAETIRDEMWRIHGDSEEFQLTSAAIDLACQLHQDQRRASPTITTSGRPLPGSEPYVVHPLRNAVRIIRWEESDPDIVIAAVLHDVVEDQAERLALTEVRSLHGLDRTETRAVALHVIRDTFGANVARTVKAVSNPIPPAGESLSREQKRGRYVAHVQQAIPDYRTFMVKAADFVDNALGLHHQDPNAQATRYLAWKYQPLCEPFVRAAQAHEAAGHHLHPDLLRKLTGAHGYLQSINPSPTLGLNRETP